MNFSDFIAHSNSLSAYSPSGDLVGVAKGFELRVFETNSLRPMHQFTFIDFVTQIDWSPDSNFILVSIAKRAMVFVKSLNDQDWNCKIDQGLAGLTFARWAPDSRFVLTVSEFNLRLSVWSLADKSSQFIRNPKHADRGVAFSKNGKTMALIQKTEDQKDIVVLYDLSQKKWTTIAQFHPELYDIEDVKFSKDGAHLICTDSPLKAQIAIFKIQEGQVTPVTKFTPYDHALGFRNVQFSPNEQYVLGACCD